jgi:NAD(P)-dependent dehydrogenase (short-subunit alcohol dehydrogenase family)
MVGGPAEREVSVDGHELTMATNALGHLALTYEALDVLDRTSGRVVWMGSMSAKLVRPAPDDLELVRSYTPWRAYAQSKLVTQTLGFQLHRGLTARGSAVRSLVAHPGYSLPVLAPEAGAVFTPPEPTAVDRLQYPWAQGHDRGALPAVFAATSPEALGGQFYGPRGGLRGEPALSGGVEGVPGAGSRGSGGPGRRSIDPLVGAAVWRFASRACALTD